MGLLYGEIPWIDDEPNVVDVLPRRIAGLLFTFFKSHREISIGRGPRTSETLKKLW